jgi:hypothetical protein
MYSVCPCALGSGGVNTTGCKDVNIASVLRSLPQPEATYIGYVPEAPLSSIMMTLEPVGEAVDCGSRLVLNNDPFYTVGTEVGVGMRNGLVWGGGGHAEVQHVVTGMCDAACTLWNRNPACACPPRTTFPTGSLCPTTVALRTTTTSTSTPACRPTTTWSSGVCVSAYKRVHACTKLHPRHLVLVHTPCSIGVSHIWLSIPAVLQ